jgi:hypothetical protein
VFTFSTGGGSGGSGGFFYPSSPTKSPTDRHGIPQISPVLDDLFNQYLSSSENWEQLLVDLSDVKEGGRRHTRF